MLSSALSVGLFLKTSKYNQFSLIKYQLLSLNELNMMVELINKYDWFLNDDHKNQLKVIKKVIKEYKDHTNTLSSEINELEKRILENKLILDKLYNTQCLSVKRLIGEYKRNIHDCRTS